MIVTEEWLGRYLEIKKDLDLLVDKLQALDGWKTPKLSENPTRSSSNEGLDGIIIKRDRIYRQYLKELKEAYKVILEIETFIEQVKDPMTKSIIRKRYIQGLTWRDVGDQLGIGGAACYKRVQKVMGLDIDGNKGSC